MKILQTPVRFFPAIGGVEKYVLDLSTQLVKAGHEVNVICADEPKSNNKFINGISITRLKYLFKVTNTNITLKLPFEIYKRKFDVIHTHMPTPWSADISILMGKFMKKKTVITIHNDIDKTSFISKIITEIYLHSVFLLSLSLVDVIIIVNKDWERTFTNTGGILKRYQHKIKVLPNGVDVNIFKPLNILKEKNTVLFVSILDKHHKYKGLDYLLESIVLVKKKIPNVKLIVVGEGELKSPYIEKTKELGIEKNVEFLGEKKENELVKLYNKSSVFVLPSTEIEGFGIVAIEAMACGVPIIATNVVGVASEIKEENCGIIIKSKSSKVLSESILKILKNSKIAKKMSDSGISLVKGRFNWSFISLNVINIYKRKD